MVYLTDIPDWCFVEAGLPAKPLDEITAGDLTSFDGMSPLQYASQVGALVLISLLPFFPPVAYPALSFTLLFV